MNEPPLLFGIVQGGLDKVLRQKSLEFVQSQSVSGIAVGGLSVGESREEMHKMLEYLAPMYDKRPRYLMGVGDPVDLKYAIEYGIDMMDCVLPTRNARHATAWVQSGCTISSCQSAKPTSPNKFVAQSGVELSGAPSEYQLYTSIRSSSSPSSTSTCTNCGRGYDVKIHLTNEQYINDPSPIDKACDCYTCKTGFSRGFLRHQFKVGESLAGSLVSMHNIRYLQRICEEYQV
jgi:queuine tRNA-ribosyltransferase